MSKLLLVFRPEAGLQHGWGPRGGLSGGESVKRRIWELGDMRWLSRSSWRRSYIWQQLLYCTKQVKVVSRPEGWPLPLIMISYSHLRLKPNLRSSSTIVAVVEFAPSMTGWLVDWMDTVKSWSPSTSMSFTANIMAVTTVLSPDPRSNVTVSGPLGA